MSCSLHWRPVGGDKRVDCDLNLRNAIEDEYGLPCKLGASAIGFLRGLRAAKIEGAGRLIELIEAHDAIELFKEC